MPPGELRLHHTQQAFCFRDIALERPLVRKILAGEFVEEADLTEYRPDERHLEMQPLDRLPAPRRIGRNELAGFLREVLQDRAGLEQRERFAARTVRIDDRRNFSIGIKRKKFRRFLIVLAEVDEVRLIRQPDLLQQDRDFHAIRRTQRVQL